MAYEVFISFKHTDRGVETKDCAMARQLHQALEDKGISTFFSPVSIASEGRSEFSKEIENALDEASVLVAVCTNPEYVKSGWVEMEIDTFHADRLSGKKNPEKSALYSYVSEDVHPNDLSMALRRVQSYCKLDEVVDAVYKRLRKNKGMLPNRMAVRLDETAILAEIPLPPTAFAVSKSAKRSAIQGSGSLLQIGTVIDGKYRIEKEIGRGGMSRVYLAVDALRGKRAYAVKSVFAEAQFSWDVIRHGVIEEANLMKKLNHPAIPLIYDIIDQGNQILIIMEYIEGRSLQALIDKQGPQPEEQVRDWAMQLCDVLGYLHSQDPAIIHRDIKPANIICRPGGQLTILDFGTARTYKETNLGDTTILGTRGFAAPEQFGGFGQTDARTDIYALGVTLHYLCAGLHPSEPPFFLPKLRTVDPKISRGLEAIVAKCMESDPEKRYQSAQELKKALKKLPDVSKGGVLSAFSSLFEKKPATQASQTSESRPVPPAKPGSAPSSLAPIPRPQPIPVSKPTPQPIPVSKPFVPAIPTPIPVSKPFVPAIPTPIPVSKPIVPAIPTPIPVPAAPVRSASALLLENATLGLIADAQAQEGSRIWLEPVTRKTARDFVRRISTSENQHRGDIGKQLFDLYSDDELRAYLICDTLEFSPCVRQLRGDAVDAQALSFTVTKAMPAPSHCVDVQVYKNGEKLVQFRLNLQGEV